MRAITSALDNIFIKPDVQEEHTGAMVALIPEDKYIEELVKPDGEPAHDLHVTLLYLGEAADWSNEEQQKLLDWCQENYSNSGKIDAEIKARATFNFDSDEPASVYLVAGEGAVKCEEIEKELRKEIERGNYPEVPHDYPFYTPHITIGYNYDTDKLDFSGPIRFDKIRVAFGNDVTDFGLGS